MNPQWLPAVTAVGLLAAMLAFQEIGYRFGRRRSERNADEAASGVVDGAIFALLGLILAFSFGGAAGRLDTRRQQIVEEANTIGTAWLRLDLLPEQGRTELHELFRAYADNRISTFASLPDIAAAESALAEGARLQQLIWHTARQACDERGDTAATLLVLPAVNEMIDITAVRTASARTHLPTLVILLMIVISLACALIAGIGMSRSGKRRPFHAALLAVVTALTVFVIMDLEYPRAGFIQLDDADRAMLEVREMMR